MVRKKPPLSLVGSSTTGPPLERRLGAAGQSMWDAVTTEYDISDVGGIAILMQICFAQDRLDQVMAQIEADGLMIYGKTPKVHPGVREELALRSFICRGLTRLGLNVETIKPVGRPAGWSPS